jgi:ATP-binding cassette, subfamily C (CFTR/MRP), member 1
LVSAVAVYVGSLLTRPVAEIPGCLAPVATFAAFAIQAQVTGSEGLNITQAFTSLSIITLTTGPAEGLLAAIPGTASSLGSFERVQKFLLAPPHEDKRVLLGETQGLSSRSASEPKIPYEGVELSEIHTGRVPSPKPSAFLIEDATIRPSPNANPILKNVSFNVDRGSILMIAGPVGSGKTTLLKVLLGELDCDTGIISAISNRCSYCAQSPWLSNCSIQQNICGPNSRTSAIDEAWYQTVIRACALDVDISMLADGDRTIIGSKGVTLSGGQKQRVALARALYARHDLVILDDVFSALDRSTERLVFERTFGKNGLVRKLGSTVILVTHTSTPPWDLVFHS